MEKEEDDIGYQPADKGINSSNENEACSRNSSAVELNYRQKCTQIDVLCFFSFIILYATFISVYLYLLL